jgi:tripartite-type tricarboxylate transporter receptor subunit TctC
MYASCLLRRLARSVLSSCAAACTLLLALPFTQAYARPIELVVPYAPGGFTDRLARLVASELSKKWNEQVLVLNKTGAGSLIAMKYVIDQNETEGRTILMGSLGYLTLQFRGGGSPFNADALAPTVFLGSVPSVLYINAAIPVETLAEFIAWGRKKPGGVAFGTSGQASSPHLNAEDLAARTGLPLIVVPFQGSGASIPAAAGGHIDAVFESTGSRGQVKGGKLKALFVGNDRPLASWPELPTAEAAGVPGFRAGSWFGLFVHAKTPAAVQERINRDVNEALKAATITELSAQMDFFVKGGSKADFARFLADEKKRLEQLIKERRIHVE